MDAASVSPKIAKFTISTILESRLAQIDHGLFAAADAETMKKLNLKRKAMFEEIGATAYTRYHAGNAVREYHALYRHQGEKKWKKKAGPVVMEALGYKSLKSVYSLMHDARVARKLGDAKCKAMVDRGYDPASRKYASIANELLRPPKGQKPVNAETAVETAIDHYKEQKKQSKASAADPEEFRKKIADRLAEQIFSFAKRVEGQVSFAIFDGIVQQARTLLVEKIAKANSKTAARAKQSKRKSGQAPAAAIGGEGSAESAGAQQAKPSELAKLTIITPKPSPKPLRLRGPAHPWGDACLHSLRFLDEELKRVEYHRDWLHGVLDDHSPKRFFVNSPNFFDLERMDVIREHISVFNDARWHIFQVLVNDLEHARGIRSEMKRSGVSWSTNLWIGTSVESEKDFPRIKALAEIGHDECWISFAGFRSNPLHPLANSGLAAILRRYMPRWIVGRADFESGPDFSVNDALHLQKIAHDMACAIFFTQAQTKAAFLSGADEAAASPAVHDARIRELLRSKAFPSWPYRLQQPSAPKLFAPFEGEPVEYLTIRGDASGEIMVGG